MPWIASNVHINIMICDIKWRKLYSCFFLYISKSLQTITSLFKVAMVAELTKRVLYSCLSVSPLPHNIYPLCWVRQFKVMTNEISQQTKTSYRQPLQWCFVGGKIICTTRWWELDTFIVQLLSFWLIRKRIEEREVMKEIEEINKWNTK